MDQDQNTSATSGAEIRWAKERQYDGVATFLFCSPRAARLWRIQRARETQGVVHKKEVRPLASTLPLRENGRRDLFLPTNNHAMPKSG